jgi:hypothetical protein
LGTGSDSRASTELIAGDPSFRKNDRPQCWLLKSLAFINLGSAKAGPWQSLLQPAARLAAVMG